MQTRIPAPYRLALLACAWLAAFVPAPGGDEAAGAAIRWEISLQSTVAWPPLAAPAAEAPAGKQAGRDEGGGGSTAVADPAMITERTLQASLYGRLQRIADGIVWFAPALGGGDPVPIPLERILSLRNASSPERESGTEVEAPAPGNGTGDSAAEDASLQRLVTLRGGSSVPGRLLRVSEQGLVLAFGDSGGLTMPLDQILSITPLQSNGRGLGKLPPADGRHVARLTTGEIVTGNIAPVTGESDRLTISSPILSGEFPLSLIESMLFPAGPDPADPAAPSSEAEPGQAGRVAVVSFAGGASLLSPRIALSDGMLELEIWEGQPFRLPLGSAESISFPTRGGMRANGPLFLWGQHADLDDEFEKVQAALRDAVQGREVIVMKGDEDSSDFTAALGRSSAFVWGEWENLDEAGFADALSAEKGRPLGDQLQSYVRAGGIAIFLGMSAGTVEFFARLGLGEVTPAGSIGDGSELELTGPGETLAPYMKGGVKATNSTMMYAAPEGGTWTPLLCQPGSPAKAAILGRRIGSGWVFLMGMDFYETDANVTRLLVELTQFRR